MPPLISPEGAGNAPELTVSDLAGALKRTIEDAFGHVRLRGEISGYRGPHSSGHVYFSLKDANAKIDAVIWKGVFGRLRFRPEEGLEVIATGKVTTFPGKSTYQIVIDHLEPAGVGALMALLEERRRKLAAEGLFDPARKQLIPYLPRVIGVITSPTGAVIRDILHRLSDRFPRSVLVWPVRVQGETSAAEVAAAIAGFNALPPDGPVPRPDVLIVARGGGSLEDLWSFNEEIVVRAAADSAIPLISAVGHETDTTLIDFAADRRAPTPTAAAEMAVPVRADLIAGVRTFGARSTGAMARMLDQRRAALRSAARALPDGEDLLASQRQRVDLAGVRLAAAARAGIDRRRGVLAGLARRLQGQTPEARLARFGERIAGLAARLGAAPALMQRQRRQALETLGQRHLRALVHRLSLERTESAHRRDRLATLAARLQRAGRDRFQRDRQRLATLAALINSLGYRQVLARGFALVRDQAGQPVRASAAVSPGMALTIELADGAFAARAGEGDPAAADARPRAAPPRTTKPKDGRGGQGDLF